MPARQQATALVRGSSGTRATARSRSETSSMRPTPALLALVLCASIHARPWQLAHCRGPKQAKYSAAWLAASDLLRAFPESYLNTSRLFKRGTMMEAASFLLLRRKKTRTATFKTRGLPRLLRHRAPVVVRAAFDRGHEPARSQGEGPRGREESARDEAESHVISAEAAPPGRRRRDALLRPGPGTRPVGRRAARYLLKCDARFRAGRADANRCRCCA